MQDVLLCMPQVAPSVTIIVPAYNAAAFLKETIDSVKSQGFTDWEMIIVNDGSTDDTLAVIKSESDARIRLIDQENQGVSAARNTGLKDAKGKYVVFLDADDLLGDSFIESRLNAFEEHPSIGFSCGWVETFPGKTALARGVTRDAEEEILFFKPGTTTVPSNYMIKRSVLLDKNIFFNTNLSSTADRFFLLQLAKVVNGELISSDRGRLLYRISANSMSHNINPGLIFDNVLFYQEISNADLMPKKRSRFKSQFFFSIALGFMKAGKFLQSVKFLTRSGFSHPVVFVRLLISRFMKQPH